jgi:hypothetical protein
MMIRRLAIVAALCLFGTSASALTMEECRAKYKAAMDKSTKSGIGMDWAQFQVKDAVLAPTPLSRNQPLARA